MGEFSNISIPWSEWRIVRKLGKGGFGAVYEIERDIYGAKEKAALKIISIPEDESQIEADYSDGYDKLSIAKKYKEHLQGLANEYQMMAKLKGHPNIVNCEDTAAVAHPDGIGWDLYIRMELLTPLLGAVRKRKFTEANIISLGKDVSRALVTCQEKNIIHRDIKPENIMLSEYGIFKLGDFGISKTMDHTTRATQIGSGRYMAPEVFKREKYGKEADIYSLGLMMYWLLNNRRMPFIKGNQPPTATEAEEAWNKRIDGVPIPEPVNGSRELKRIVLRACAYKPEARYRLAKEMLSDLEALEKGNTTYSFTGDNITYESEIATDDTMGSGWEENETVGMSGSYTQQTAGNSWSDGQQTIGRAGGSTWQTKESDEPTMRADTVGKEPENNSKKTVKSNEKVVAASKSKSFVGKMFFCLIVGIVVCVVKGILNDTTMNDTTMNDATTDSILNSELVDIFDNCSDIYEYNEESKVNEISYKWLKDNGYTYKSDSDDSKIFILGKGERQWESGITLSPYQIHYADFSDPPGDGIRSDEIAHERYIELYGICKERWEVIFEADQTNQRDSKDHIAEISLFEGKDKHIYRLTRIQELVELSYESVYHWNKITDVDTISIPWDLIASVDLSSKENFFAWADANGYEVEMDSQDSGRLYQTKDENSILEERLSFFYKENDIFLYVTSYDGDNITEIIKQILFLLETEGNSEVRASKQGYIMCEYSDKEIYLTTPITSGWLRINEKTK